MSEIIHALKPPEREDGVFTVVIDGTAYSSYFSLAFDLGEKLGFLSKGSYPYDRAEGFLDMMKELSQIEEPSVRIVLLNSDEAYDANPDAVGTFIEEFRSVIAPYWNDRAEKSASDENPVKNVDLVLVKSGDEGFFERFFRMRETRVFGDEKLSCKTSLPVLREKNGEIVVSVFVVFMTAEDFRNGLYERPTLVADFDLKNGHLIEKIRTKEEEFSDFGYDEKLPLDMMGDKYFRKFGTNSVEQMKNRERLRNEAFSALDGVRRKFLETGEFDSKEYGRYFDLLLEYSCDSFRKFYEDLGGELRNGRK